MPPITSEVLKLTGACPLLAGLSASELDDALRAGAVHQYRRSEMLIRQGQTATAQHLILSARLRVTQVSPDGREMLLRFLIPGETVGGVAALGDLVYSGSAQAVEPSRTLVWSSAAFTRLLDRCPRLARNTMHLMAQRIQELQARCADLATQRVECRVAHALLRLGAPASQSAPTIRLSRLDLAEMTGTSLFTVSRILGRWARQGIVTTGRKRVMIRDSTRLAAIGSDLSP